MIVLLGKQGSGKTTVMRELINRFNYKQVITYTTRPPRKGERLDVDYHFIDEETFMKMVAERKFVEYQRHRDWWYGTPIDDKFDENSIIVLTPTGYSELIGHLIGTHNYKALNELVVFNLVVDDLSRFIKLIVARGNIREILRRFKQDNRDFSALAMDNTVGSNVIEIKNNYYNTDAWIIAEKIQKFYIQTIHLRKKNILKFPEAVRF